MMTDRYGGQHSSADPCAVRQFEQAVVNFATHQPVFPSLDAAATRDPGLVSALALRGFGHALLGRQAGLVEAGRMAAQTTARVAALASATRCERALAQALTWTAAGQFKRAAAILERHLEAVPTHFLAAKLSHALRFMTGGAERMLATTSRVLPSMPAEHPGYGFLLGCHAFALEETGHHAEAEITGRQAVAIEPGDVWGLHAVAHVMEMRGRTRDGTQWLEGAQPLWSGRVGFGLHLAWHLALFRLAEGDVESVLALYDAHIEPTPSSDFRDMMNAVSILWRLEQEHCDVGSRWEHLRQIALDRRTDATYVLGSLHYLLALVATGDFAAAGELIAAMRASAQRGDCEQAILCERVGVPLAEIIVSTSMRGVVRQDFDRLAGLLPALGGSNAQRDVFLRELLALAVNTGDSASICALSGLRLQQRSFDRFHAMLDRRMVKKLVAGGKRMTPAPAAGPSR